MVSRLTRALSDPNLVQSFSGVRTVFGQGPGISPELEALASAYAYIYARDAVRAASATLLIGRDPRPTGAAVARAMARGFLAAGKARLVIIDLGVITTPLAETAIRALDADGGVMITASHNPIDNNGFKFLTGCTDGSDDAAPAGALLSAKAMARVIASVASIGSDLGRRIGAVTEEAIDSALANPENDQSRITAERAYLDVTGADWGVAPHCLKPLTLGPVLVDPNGGAGCGIDSRVLEHFGVRTIEINAELGYPEHAIDTDGIDPASGRHMLLRVARAAARNGAHFGVAFDYDADRGNLVLPGYDESAIIPPQRVAAFNIALALARRRLQGGGGRALAVVCSDATSLASHRVAEAFGAEVFQVETGEINVVTKMHQLREAGYDVPVGVEGANGGTIFGSATCRDGLQVALSAAQAESTPEIACEWMKIVSGLNGCRFDGASGVSLRELVNSVPENPNLMLKLTLSPSKGAPDMPQAVIKRRIEETFRDETWKSLSFGFERYEFQNFEETEMVATRTGDESGAWRVMLHATGRRAFIFIRGSRTESGVWRMIIDADSPDDFAPLVEAAQSLFTTATESGSL